MMAEAASDHSLGHCMRTTSLDSSNPLLMQAGVFFLLLIGAVNLVNSF